MWLAECSGREALLGVTAAMGVAADVGVAAMGVVTAVGVGISGGISTLFRWDIICSSLSTLSLTAGRIWLVEPLTHARPTLQTSTF